MGRYQNLMSNTRAPNLEKEDSYNISGEELPEQKQRRLNHLSEITKPNRPRQTQPILQMPESRLPQSQPNNAENTSRPKINSQPVVDKPNKSKFTEQVFKNDSDSEEEEDENVSFKGAIFSFISLDSRGIVKQNFK